MTDISVSASLLSRAAKRNGYAVPAKGLVFFGIRGLSPDHPFENTFAQSQPTHFSAYDFRRMRCTLGQWKVETGEVALFPGSTAYAAQKAALVHAARILAKECRGPANIRVNVVGPGVTAAGMAEASVASGKYDRYLKEGVIPRFGRPEDVARAVRFFLEPDNYVTGQVLTVDGGLTL